MGKSCYPSRICKFGDVHNGDETGDIEAKLKEAEARAEKAETELV